jgi:hypothetical protein
MYQVKIIYTNLADAVGPIGGVWTGSIASKIYPIEFVKGN